MAFGVAAVVAVADQSTKFWADRSLQNRSIMLLPTVELRRTFNSGMPFGAGSSHGQLLAIVILAVCVGIARAITKQTDRWAAIPLGAVLGGATGNLIDRASGVTNGVFSGDVKDFIAVRWFTVFNVADIFVVTGGIALALNGLLRRPETA